MKRFMKSSLAVVLCLIMLIGIMPMNAFAEDEKQGLAAENEISISDETVMGRIVNNTLSTASAGSDGFSISYIEVSEKIATVSISNETACKLIVAIYDPDTNQMLGSGMKDIEAAAGSVDVEIDISSMPEYFVVKAFALDSDMSALCDKYESRHYTKEFEEFYEKTPDDFETSDVIIMQDDTSGYEDEEIDFGVLIDDVVVEKSSSEMTYEYDNDAETYSFFNCTDKVKSLKSGDVYYFQYGENNTEFIVIKVESVTTEGNNVYVKENPEIGIADAFSYLKIDSYGDYDTAEIKDVGEGITIEDEAISTQNFNYDDKFSKDVSVSINVQDKKNLGSITGSAKVSLSVNAKCYYDAKLFGKDYYELKTETKTTVSGSVTISGKVDVLNDIKFFDEAVYVGVFDLEVTIKPVFSISGSVSFEFILSKKITVTSDSENSLNKTEKSDDSFKPDGDVSSSISIKIGLNVTIKLALYAPPHGKDLAKKTQIKILKDAYAEVVSLSVTLSAGIKGNIKTEDKTPLHPCELCASGTINLYAGLSGKLKITIVPKILDFTAEITIASYEKPIWDLYWSKTATPHFEVGECGTVCCPNKYFKLQVKVADGSGKSISGATVSADGCKCDVENDKKYDDSSILTDANGKADIYLKKGSYTIKASYKNNSSSTTCNILQSNSPITIVIKLNPGGVNQFDIISFGSYPQSMVCDSSLISSLNSKAGNNSNWNSYNYYKEMNASNFMRYKDITYNGQKYRGVVFNSYRPNITSNSSEDNNQEDNGFSTNKVYWFKYEPIEWKVIDSDKGLVVCNSVIDSQAFNNYVISYDDEYYGSTSKSYYASDYGKSSLKKWLNEDFYNTAFNTQQQELIIKNCTISAESTWSSEYDGTTTSNNNVFILSCDDVFNSNYGFAYDFLYQGDDINRQKKSTEYAKCQGCETDSNGYSNWWVRSPYLSSDSTIVTCGGDSFWFSCDVDYTNVGVVPALYLNLKSFATQSVDSFGTSKNISSVVSCSYSFSQCIRGEKYILIQLSNCNSDVKLNSNNLEYIDQVTSNENGVVSGLFSPQNYDKSNVTFLIGDFGNGIEAKNIDDVINVSGISDIAIKSYADIITVDYKSKLVFHADYNYLPDGASVLWVVENSNGPFRYVTSDELVIDFATENYKVTANVVYLNTADVTKSVIICESQTEYIIVNTSFFAKLIAFFRDLFQSLPVYIDNKKR